MANVFIHGNFQQKYHSKNPIIYGLMKNFLKHLTGLLDLCKGRNIKNICEIGCGDGEILKILHQKFPDAQLFACDLSPEEIIKAKENCKGIDIHFSVQDAEYLSGFHENQFELVVCCEVLEHLQNPEHGLLEIQRITDDYAIISVPNEPIWRILNVIRGKYLSQFGNTPGHLNHWNVKSFALFVSQAPLLINQNFAFPFPWQMCIMKKTINKHQQVLPPT